jgi:biotin transport system permease protein
VTLVLYLPRESPAHRTPAGVKLLALAGLGALLFAAPTLPVTAGALVAMLLIGHFVARLPVALLARQGRAVMVLVIAIVAVQALLADVLMGVAAALRLLALVLAATVVTATTRVTAMVAGVERVCAPLRLLGVRPARIGLVVAMALRFIPLVAERADRIREAQAARGGPARGLRALTRTAVPLLVQVLQLAHTVSEGLDARAADEAAPSRPYGSKPHDGRPGRRPVHAGRREYPIWRSMEELGYLRIRPRGALKPDGTTPRPGWSGRGRAMP